MARIIGPAIVAAGFLLLLARMVALEASNRALVAACYEQCRTDTECEACDVAAGVPDDDWAVQP